MTRSSTAVAFAIVLTLLPSVARAQSWRDVGPTRDSNMVSVDTSNMRRTGDSVATEVRVVYAKPIERPEGRWASLTARATFDCAGQRVAVSELWSYADVRSKHVIQRGKPLFAGFVSPPKGSLGEVAMSWVCAGSNQGQESKSP